MEGHYEHFTLSSTFHSPEELFCQTFYQNGFSFTGSAPPTQPQPELTQQRPQPHQTHPASRSLPVNLIAPAMSGDCISSTPGEHTPSYSCFR
jgi:hypothetical protein